MALVVIGSEMFWMEQVSGFMYRAPLGGGTLQWQGGGRGSDWVPALDKQGQQVRVFHPRDHLRKVVLDQVLR